MAHSGRTFRVFVSSTFSDLKVERNALQERVFPRLRGLCQQHGCRFQVVDLRWGVSEEAALDQQTMRICLGEVERCQAVSPRPNFIVLLGNRYGWRPLPYEIPVRELEQILRRVNDQEADLLRTWYRRNDNALPPVFCLQARTGQFEVYEIWEPVEQRLHAILETTTTQLDLFPDQMLKYTASATEQEIMDGALRVADARDHVFCYVRDIENLPHDHRAAGFLDLNVDGTPDPSAADSLTALKSKLSRYLQDNIHTYRSRWTESGPSLDHLNRLCDEVYDDLAKILRTEFALLEEVEPLEVEVAAHEDFARERARNFVGRDDSLSAIAAYLNSNANFPFAVWGQAGCGKSALMAKAIQRAREACPDAELMYRFMGVTPDTTNGRRLLESLCRQLTRIYGGDVSSIPHEYRELAEEFPKRMAFAAERKSLVLFLDALDQLSESDNARSLGWLPAALPPNVHMVVSTLPGECLEPLEGKLPDTHRVEILPMPASDGEALLDTWLSEAKCTLQPEQKSHILSLFNQSRLPLFLKLAFEEARLWKSYDRIPDLRADIPGMIRELFMRLSSESNHGEVLVTRTLGYLAAAKNGLSEDEIIDVLSLDQEVIADFLRRSPKSPKVERLPVVLWSRLFFDLEPYLSERTADGVNLLSFYHRQLGEVITADYLQENNKKERHQSLAHFFNNQALHLERDGKSLPNLRKLSELPYQQTCAGLWDDLVTTLTDFRFLESKAASVGVIENYDPQGTSGRMYTGVYGLLEDYEQAIHSLQMQPDQS